jgi:hypothetical protein
MAEQRVRGVSLRGEDPKRLQLSDGSRLMLDGTADQDRVEWRRLGRRRHGVSVSEAASLAGEEFAPYVAVRTRAEAQWLRAMSDWCRLQADRLEGEMAEAWRGAPS